MPNTNNQNNDINMDFTSNKKFMLLKPRQCKFCSIHIETLKEISRFCTFNPSQILYISLTPKNLYLACWAISYISSIPKWIRYQYFACVIHLIDTTPVQAVKLPTMTVTRLSSHLDKSELEKQPLEVFCKKRCS